MKLVPWTRDLTFFVFPRIFSIPWAEGKQQMVFAWLRFRVIWGDQINLRRQEKPVKPG